MNPQGRDQFGPAQGVCVCVCECVCVCACARTKEGRGIKVRSDVRNLIGKCLTVKAITIFLCQN